LERGEAYFGKANEEGVAIIYPRANKSMNYGSKDQGRDRSSDCPQASQMVIA
jgi:hypothetical protein